MTSTRVALYAVGWASLAALWAVSYMASTLGTWATPGPPFGILQPGGYTDDIPGYIVHVVGVAAVVVGTGLVTLNLGTTEREIRPRAVIVVTLSYLSMAAVVVTAFAPAWALLAPGSWEPSDLSPAELRADAASSVPIVLSTATIPIAAFGLALIATALRGSLSARVAGVSYAAGALSTVHLALVLVAGATAVDSTYSLAHMEEHASEALALAGLGVVAGYILMEVGVFVVRRLRRRATAEPDPGAIKPRIDS